MPDIGLRYAWKLHLITKYLLDTSSPSGGESGQVSDIACQEGWGQEADVETDFCDIWICEIVKDRSMILVIKTDMWYLLQLE